MLDRQKIKELVKQAIEKDPLKQDIQKISLFGSYLGKSPREDSDIDLLIEFSPSARVGFFRFVGIQENLKKLLGKEVDLLTPEAVSKYFRAEVVKQAEVIYGK